MLHCIIVTIHSRVTALEFGQGKNKFVISLPSQESHLSKLLLLTEWSEIDSVAVVSDYLH